MSLAALTISPTVPGRIHRAGFGWINVGGTTWEQDRVLWPARVSGPWWRRRRHAFDAADAADLLVGAPPVDELILGTGWMGMLRADPQELGDFLRARGITIHILRTDAAILRLQSAALAGRRVVGALHLTC